MSDGLRCTCGHICPSLEERMIDDEVQCVHRDDCELMTGIRGQGDLISRSEAETAIEAKYTNAGPSGTLGFEKQWSHNEGISEALVAIHNLPAARPDYEAVARRAARRLYEELDLKFVQHHLVPDISEMAAIIFETLKGADHA